MRIVVAICLLLVTASGVAQIRVSDNHRYLADSTGQPFFWLGDTDWELFHRMTREDTETFLETRRKQGFNVIQAVALAEFNGIRQPNRYGDWPLNNEDPTQLNITPGSDPKSAYEYDYWDHVDFVIDKIIEKGMYVGLLPTWGDKVVPMWGEGPKIFNEQNAEVYARTLATRYKSKNANIIWIIGGDRPPVYKDGDDRAIWRAMARGIEDVLGKDAFITYHPPGGQSTSTNLHNEEWLDMNAQQSSHGTREIEVWKMIANDISLKPTKPVLDMEPCYEDHPVNPWDGKWTRAGRGYFTAYDVRARIYRGVFAGGCGVTYGHHAVWGFANKELYAPITNGDTILTWQQASEAAAANQMKHLKNLMLSRPYFVRIPDQSIILSKAGTDYKDLLIATRDANNTYAFIYLPQNEPVTIDVSRISGSTKKVYWYSPETGKVTPGADAKSGQRTFTPPKEGKDWVLVIDDASRKYSPPGTIQ
ncbi:MAG TPA: glycoside hydrolase family 140 protein [Cyclobacteriaceae bacterium]|nr:glycoside hydrolase family 140 protein [Cyclobacteriaceae bacterium]